MQVGLQAINAWNAALIRDVKAGGTLQISLAQSNDAGSAVTVYGSNDEPGSMSLQPYEGGETLIGTIPPPYNAITGVIVLVDNSLNNNYLYASFLHEFGHSLGLNHNQHQNSVMWPTLSCYAKGGQPLPPSTDTSYLENTYDPYLILKTANYKTVGCPGGVFKYDPNETDYVGNVVPLYTLEIWTVKKPIGPCGQRSSPNVGIASTPKDGAPDIQAAAGPSASAHLSAQNAPSSHQINSMFGQAARSILGSSYQSNLLIDLDDHSESATLSLTSLYLASTLVAYVQIGPVVRYHRDGPIRLAIREAKILKLLRHDLGPDSTRKVGDVIYIADYEGSRGEAFVDDLPLIRGTNSVVFLRPANRGVRLLFAGSSYRLTSRHISKMALSLEGRLTPYSAYDAIINRDLDSPDGRALNTLLQAKPAFEAATEDALLTRFLRNRGVTSQLALGGYESLLGKNEGAVLNWLRRSQP